MNRLVCYVNDGVGCFLPVDCILRDACEGNHHAKNEGEYFFHNRNFRKFAQNFITSKRKVIFLHTLSYNLKDRIIIQASISPALAEQVIKQADGNISQYIKDAIRFYETFGVDDECLRKINDGAFKETKNILRHIKSVNFLYSPQIEALETH